MFLRFFMDNELKMRYNIFRSARFIYRGISRTEKNERHDKTMSKIIKRLIAVTLSAVMIVSVAGCNLYNENNLWAAEKGDKKLSIGGYIYYLNLAFSEASGKVSTEQKVMDSTIDGEKAETWIRNKALEYVNQHFYIDEKFDELGLELTEEDQTTIDGNTDYMWSYYGSAYEAVGVSRESFSAVYTEYSQKYSKIFNQMYGPEGEKAVSDEEITSYYEENYYSYEAISLPVTTTDDEGNSVAMEDEDKENVKADLEDLKKQIESGEVTMEAAAATYTGSHEELTDTTIYSSNTGVIADASSVLQNAVVSLDEGETSEVIEDTSYYYLIVRLPIADKTEETLADESTKSSLLSAMKSEEFSKYVEEQSASMEGITLNDSGIKSVSISTLVSEDNEKGTSSVSSEDESAESSVSESSET